VAGLVCCPLFSQHSCSRLHPLIRSRSFVGPHVQGERGLVGHNCEHGWTLAWVNQPLQCHLSENTRLHHGGRAHTWFMRSKCTGRPEIFGAGGRVQGSSFFFFEELKKQPRIMRGHGSPAESSSTGRERESLCGCGSGQLGCVNF